jgi:hypothetical protein
MPEPDHTSCCDQSNCYAKKQSDDAVVRRYELYREYLKHEDNLINYRLTWNITIQGFLFAACGFFFKPADGPAPSGGAASAIPTYVLVIPVTGFFISAAAILGIVAAQRAIRRLEDCWLCLPAVYANARNAELPALPPLAGGGAPNSVFFGSLISWLVPAIICAAWFSIFIFMKLQR